jgi:hypothetical protein
MRLALLVVVPILAMVAAYGLVVEFIGIVEQILVNLPWL